MCYCYLGQGQGVGQSVEICLGEESVGECWQGEG